MVNVRVVLFTVKSECNVFLILSTKTANLSPRVPILVDIVNVFVEPSPENCCTLNNSNLSCV